MYLFVLHAGTSECGFYRINLFNLLAQNSNDNSCIFLYYMPELPNVGSIELIPTFRTS